MLGYILAAVVTEKVVKGIGEAVADAAIDVASSQAEVAREKLDFVYTGNC